MTFDPATGDQGPCDLPFRLGAVLRCLLLACTFGLLLTVLAPGQAQAHAMHGDAVLVDAGSAEGGGTLPARETSDCGTVCCPATCASALAVQAHSDPGPRSATDRFALPADAHAEGFPQSALRRPPRA